MKHGNADGLSRLQTDVIEITHPQPSKVDWSCLPFEGKKCICVGVTELEAQGDTDDNFTILSAAHDENTCNGHREAARVNCKVVRHEMTIDEPRVRVAARHVQPIVDGLFKPTLLQVSAASEALFMYWHEWKRLELVNSLLYRRWEARDGGHHYMQLVLPFVYQEKMCAAFHDSDAAAHMGKRRTFNQVHRRVFWYRMEEDIKFWIRTCDICQRRKRPEKTRSTAYQAAANGGVERFNHTMCKMLSALTEHDRKSWDDKLAYACQAYNSTRHKTTGIEPNLRMFGRQPDLPWDVMVPKRPDSEPMLQHDYIKKVKRDMRRIHQLAREKAGKATTVIKRYNDRKSHLNLYQVGDLVMLRSYKIMPGLIKLKDNYEGPVFIIDVVSDITFRVTKDVRSKAKIVHHDRLKPYCVRTAEQNDNQWIFDYAKAYKRRAPEKVLQLKITDGILSTDVLSKKVTKSSAVLNAPETTVTTEPNVLPTNAERSEGVGTVTTQLTVAREATDISEEITTGITASIFKTSEVLSEISIASVAPSFASTPKSSRHLPYCLDANSNLADSASGIKQTSPARVTAPATVLLGTMSANKALNCSDDNTDVNSESDADSRGECDMSLDVYGSDTGQKDKKYVRRFSPLKDGDDTSSRPYTVWIKNTNRGGGHGRGRRRGGEKQ